MYINSVRRGFGNLYGGKESIFLDVCPRRATDAKITVTRPDVNYTLHMINRPSCPS